MSDETMTDKEWEKFFDLMHKIIGLSMSANERGELIRDKAINYSGETDLQEFCSVAADE